MKKLKNIDKRPYSGIFKPFNKKKYKGNVTTLFIGLVGKNVL